MNLKIKICIQFPMYKSATYFKLVYYFKIKYIKTINVLSQTHTHTPNKLKFRNYNTMTTFIIHNFLNIKYPLN